jgi:cytochrome c-type biogenesis protein CcmF
MNALPLYVLRGNTTFAIDDEVEAYGLKFSFWKIDPETETFHIRVSEKVSNTNDFIIMKAIIFPFINILWIGCLVMIVGISISILQRVRRTITI